MKNKNILVLLFIAGILFIFLIFRLNNKPNSSASFKSGLQKEFSDSIDKLGSASAFAKVKSDYASKSFSDQHNASHIFGEILFDKKGAAGISACDNTFGFGCYHGFFIEAVNKDGPSAALDLDKACVEKYGVLGLGCPHGIGHGLVEFFGHSMDKLSKSLDVCSKLSWKGEVFGCSSGVFMEYNSPTVFGKNSTAGLRPFDSSDPLSPCNHVDSKYRSSCYFEIGSYWTSAYSKDPAVIAGFCDKVADEKNKNYCLIGFGYSIAQVEDFNVVNTKKDCDLLSEDEAVHCRAGASWIFFAIPKERDFSDSLCDDLSPDAKTTCLKEANILGLKDK